MQTTPTRHRILAAVAAVGIVAALIAAAAGEHRATQARLAALEKHNTILQTMLNAEQGHAERFRALVLSHCAGDLPQLVAAMQAADAKAAAAAREAAQ